MPQQACFVIADVTGYTAFLTKSELEHAQDILKSLFDTLLDAITPPLVISNFQGDAVLTFAPEGSFAEGQILLETVETIYGRFARQKELMSANTTCTCRACANIPTLDLKLFIHYGEYVIQDMRGKAELSGPDVILTHRMMKNRVREQHDLQAYALFSKAAIDRLGLQDFTCEMYPYDDSYEHIGAVQMYAYCLKTMWEREREKHRHAVVPEEAWYIVEAEVPAPPYRVWEAFQNPQKRLAFMQVNDVTLSGKTNGRVGAGSTFHCAHGANLTADLLLIDWKPFDYFTERISGLPMGMTATTTTRLTPTETGTHVALIQGRLQPPNALVGIVLRLLGPMFQRMFKKGDVEALARLPGVVMAELAAEPLANSQPHGA